MARAENRKYHYIYKITCKITNRFYIGMHSTDNLDDGYFGSGKRLWRSINYHGKENHVKEILEFLPSRQALKEREKEIVNKELLGENLCMNLREGGDGGFSSETQKNNCIREGKKAFLLKLKTDEIFHKEWKLKLSNSIRKTYASGKHNYKPTFGFKDKKHSEETKQKMRKTKNVGETNSQYGTCWITKDGLNKKIKKEDLETYINEGWAKGRK